MYGYYRKQELVAFILLAAALGFLAHSWRQNRKQVASNSNRFLGRDEKAVIKF